MNTSWDIIIIGSGPAGLTAAMYAARAELKTLVLEGSNYGGQLMTTTEIENYPGYPDGIDGFALIENMRTQATKAGATLLGVDVISVQFEEHKHEITTKDEVYLASSVIIATGATAKRLGLPFEDIFWNHGISACAVCDGALPRFRNKPLAVVGGGDTACEEALFLTKYASKVYMLVRTDKMRASKIMQKRVMDHPKIEMLYHTEVKDAFGNTSLEGIILNNGNSINLSGLFYGIGHQPNTTFLKGQLDLNATGYIITDHTKTGRPGVFACGDVQDATYRQAITAAGSGCMAALEAERYLSH